MDAIILLVMTLLVLIVPVFVYMHFTHIDPPPRNITTLQQLCRSYEQSSSDHNSPNAA